jgi:hypothetical protein
MVSLERYAILRASIELTGDRGRVLAEADILPREWLLIERRWHRQLTADAARGRTDLATRYLAAFNRSIEGSAPARAIAPSAVIPPPSVAPLPRSADPAPAPTSAPSPQAPQRPMPSYLMGTRPPAPVAATPPTTGELDNQRLRRAPLPFQGGPAAPSVPQPASARVPVPSPPPAQTAFLDAAALSRPSMPFDARGGAEPPPTQAAAAPAQHDTGTAIADEQPLDLVPPAVPAELPTLSVDQYAWVTATLKRAKAADLEATLTRLRLTSDSRVSLDAIWKAHMARHPAVKQAFILALGRHLSPP